MSGNLTLSGNLTAAVNALFVNAANGRVGIGTLLPTHTLTVNGDVNLNNSLYVNKTTGNVGINATAPSNSLHVNGTFLVQTLAGITGLFQNALGNVGIGTTTPNQKLTVVGNLNLTGYITGTDNNQSYTNLLPNGNFESWSSGASSAPDEYGFNLGAGSTAGRETSVVKLGNSSVRVTNAANQHAVLQVYISNPCTSFRHFNCNWNASRYQGKTFTYGAWVKANTTQAYISLGDNTGGVKTYYSGSGNWEFLTVTKTIIPSATEFSINFVTIDVMASIYTAYVDGAILVEGYIVPPYSDKPLPDDGITLQVDSANNRVGIGTTTPTEKLMVVGNINLTGNLTATNITAQAFKTNDDKRLDNVEETASYIIYTDGTTVYAKNGTTGKIDYQSETNDAAPLLQYAMDRIGNSSTGGKIFIKKGTYTLTPQPAAEHVFLIKLRSGVTLEGEGGCATTIASGSGGSWPVSWFKTMTPIRNFIVRNLCFNDALGAAAGTTHQIFGFDSPSSNISMEDNRFINLRNAAVIANADSSPYMENFVFRRNYLNKYAANHSNGDFTEIMGKNIYILENTFDDTTSPGSVPYAISFGSNIWVMNNIVEKTVSTSTDGFLFSALTRMSGYAYAYENIFVIGNRMRHAGIGIGSGGMDPYAQFGVANAVVRDNILLNTTLNSCGGLKNVIFEGNIIGDYGAINYDGRCGGGLTTSWSSKNIMWKNNIITNYNGNYDWGFFINNASTGTEQFMFIGNMIIRPNIYNFYFNASNITGLTIVDNVGTPSKLFAFNGTYSNNLTDTFIKNNKNIGYVAENKGSSLIRYLDSISHGLATTPTSWYVFPQAPNITASATANDTDLKVTLLYINGTNPGIPVNTATTVVWAAEV